MQQVCSHTLNSSGQVLLATFSGAMISTLFTSPFIKNSVAAVMAVTVLPRPRSTNRAQNGLSLMNCRAVC